VEYFRVPSSAMDAAATAYFDYIITVIYVYSLKQKYNESNK